MEFEFCLTNRGDAEPDEERVKQNNFPDLNSLVHEGQMSSISRTSILYAVVIAVLLAALPGTIRKLIQTGDPYLFTERFFNDILTRLSGPGRLRFIVQPTVAIMLGVRSGVGDTRTGAPPFLWALAFHGNAAGSCSELPSFQSGVWSLSRFSSMSSRSFLSFTRFVPAQPCWLVRCLLRCLMF